MVDASTPPLVSLHRFAEADLRAGHQRQKIELQRGAFFIGLPIRHQLAMVLDGTYTGWCNQLAGARGWGIDMSLFRRVVSSCAVALMMSSCAALYNIDDPAIGVIAKDQIPAFQKALRCELITFFETNRRRQLLFNKERKIDREEAIEKYSYFDLDRTLYGALELDLKVIDTGGLPSTAGTNVSNKYDIVPPVGTATHSKTLTFNPSLTDQNTYEWQWWYIIPQNATLYAPRLHELAQYMPSDRPTDRFECYRAIPPDFGGLARGQYPEYEQFKRIRVNGGLPFAAWLQENADIMGTAFFAQNLKAEKAEHMIPAQMYYNFMVQVAGGINVSFSLVAPHWAPFMPVGTLSQQQTNNVQIWLNGSDAAMAAAAKTGTATAKITPATNIAPAQPGGALTPFGLPCTKNGCLLAPVPLNGPSPSPNQPPP